MAPVLKTQYTLMMKCAGTDTVTDSSFGPISFLSLQFSFNYDLKIKVRDSVPFS